MPTTDMQWLIDQIGKPIPCGLCRSPRASADLKEIIVPGAVIFDGEVVVFALGEARDGDAADDSGTFDVEGEAAAVRGVVGVGEAVAFGEGAVVLLER